MKKEFFLFLSGVVCIFFSWWSFYNLRFVNNCGCPEINTSWVSSVTFGVFGKTNPASCVLPVCRTTRDPYEFYFYFGLLGVLLILSSVISVFQKLALKKRGGF